MHYPIPQGAGSANEAWTLVEETSERLMATQRRLNAQLESLGRLPVRALLPGRGTAANAGRAYTDLMAPLGNAASLVDFFEYIPESLRRAASSEIGTETPGTLEPLFIFPSQALAQALRRLQARRWNLEASGLAPDYVKGMIGEAIKERRALDEAELEALMASQAETERILARAELPEILREATQAIKRMDLGRMNMAVTLFIIEPRRLSVAAAGMPPVLLYWHATGAVEEIALAGLPLGSFAEVAYEHQEPLSYPRTRSLFQAAAAKQPQEVIATSPETAEAIGRSLPNHRHLVTPGLAHHPTWTNCFAMNTGLLTESGSIEGLDLTCAGDYQPAKFKLPIPRFKIAVGSILLVGVGVALVLSRRRARRKS